MDLAERNRINNCLQVVPAGDVNFRSCVQRASGEQLERALTNLRQREYSKSKILAIEREIRRRLKAAK